MKTQNSILCIIKLNMESALTKMKKSRDNLKNFRFSKNRQLLLQILEAAKMPVTVDYLYEQFRENSQIISLSTIYRILEKLVLNNIVIKSLILDENKARFELNKKGHKHYLICTECNDMVPIKACPLGELEKDLQKDTGFNIQGHKLEIYGHCAKCQE